MISFEELREIHRKEKNTQTIVPMAPDFWKSVASYLKEKMDKYEKLRGETSKFTDKVLSQFEREIRNAGRVIKEIYTAREKKMLLMGFTEVATEEEVDIRGLTTEEQAVYKQVVAILKSSRDNVLTATLAGENAIEESDEEQAEPETVKLKILDKVPSFLGTDLKLYGPYEKDETVELPTKYATLLLEKKKAKEIKK
ncbi:MAG: DNA replication complex GINS family protein [Candidatus Altiarchaeota archaeon]|nr:DNA replication complex GINS family protein [Candidatus Altiarchaeota archaeon]